MGEAKMKLRNIIGAIASIMAAVLAWYWFDAKLVLVIFLAIMGNNLERSRRKQ